MDPTPSCAILGQYVAMIKHSALIATLINTNKYSRAFKTNKREWNSFQFLPPTKQAEIIKHLSSEKKCSHRMLVWFKDLLGGLTRQGLSIWVSRFYISNKALIAKVTDHLIRSDNESVLSAGAERRE